MHIVQSLHHNMKKNLLWIELDEGVREVRGLWMDYTTISRPHLLHCTCYIKIWLWSVLFSFDKLRRELFTYRYLDVPVHVPMSPDVLVLGDGNQRPQSKA